MSNGVSTDPIPSAFPSRGMVRERFDAEKDSVIESALGKQESWAKKVGAGQSGVMLDDIPRLLDVLGLKAVDKSKVCVDRDIHEAYRRIAAMALTQPEKLTWDE